MAGIINLAIVDINTVFNLAFKRKRANAPLPGFKSKHALIYLPTRLIIEANHCQTFAFKNTLFRRGIIFEIAMAIKMVRRDIEQN